MTLALLVNGESRADLTHAVAANERGLHYGDGVFETMLLTGGRVRFLDDHLLRLEMGCRRLDITPPAERALREDVARVTARLRVAVIKIIVTRGVGGRGYRPEEAAAPTRLVAAYPAPETIATEIRVNWRQTRIGRNPRLAGIKHLNRLEQVLAQTEPGSGDCDEGLMLDTEGEVVSAIAGNVFIVKDGALCTPDLRFCGVRGVMRARVLQAASRLGLGASEAPLWPHDVEQASEVFVTNAVRGVRSVIALDERRWARGEVAQRLREALQL
jgi:4-amino-4-deoxychorismate lyase